MVTMIKNNITDNVIIIKFLKKSFIFFFHTTTTTKKAAEYHQYTYFTLVGSNCHLNIMFSKKFICVECVSR